MPLINAEFFGELFLVLAMLVALSYLIYLSIRKFHRHPAFGNCVSHVLLLRASKKVIRIAAYPVIALVKYGYAIYFNSREFCRKSVSRYRNTFHFCFPVSIFGFRAKPRPTILFFSNPNIVPKPDGNRWVFTPPYGCSKPTPFCVFSSHTFIIYGE